MNGNNILVTAIGSFSADVVISRLKSMGNRLIGCDIYEKKWLPCSLDVDVFYQIPLALQEEDYINSVLEICKKESVQYIFPLTDIEIDILNTHRRELEHASVILCVSNEKSIDICRDKYKTFQLLKNNGIIEVIDTRILNEIEVDSIEYPCIVKPNNGRSSQGMQVVYDVDQLIYYKSHNIDNTVILQPKIDGRVVTVDVCRDKRNDLTISIAREELLRTLNGAGISVHIYEDKRLSRLVERIADILDVEGTVNFEFIKSDNEYRFLECNPRFSGGVAFSCISGYDFVLNSLRYFSGETIENNSSVRDQYITKKYIELITG